jgi:hypothetical protein
MCHAGGVAGTGSVPNESRKAQSEYDYAADPVWDTLVRVQTMQPGRLRLPRVCSLAGTTSPDKGFEKPAKEYYPRHLHIDGSCQNNTKRLRAVIGYFQPGGSIGQPGAGGPPGEHSMNIR